MVLSRRGERPLAKSGRAERNPKRLAKLAGLCQAVGMGNKDARKREKKKPKQKKPKREDFIQTTARIVRQAPDKV